MVNARLGWVCYIWPSTYWNGSCKLGSNVLSTHCFPIWIKMMMCISGLVCTNVCFSSGDRSCRTCRCNGMHVVSAFILSICEVMLLCQQSNYPYFLLIIL